MKKSQLIVVPNFVSESQIGYIMGLADQSAPQRDQPQDGGAVSYSRENRDRWVYSWHDDPVLNQIARNVATQLDVTLDNLEAGMQLFAHYEGGQTFHHADVLNNNGINYRSATVLLYFNDDYDGSYISFPYQGTQIKPSRGSLISYPLSVDEQTQDNRFSHSASIITKGTKYMGIFTLRTPVSNPVTQQAPLPQQAPQQAATVESIAIQQQVQSQVSEQVTMPKMLETEVLDINGVISTDQATYLADQLAASGNWVQSATYANGETKQDDYRTSDSIGEESLPDPVKSYVKEILTPLFQTMLADEGGNIDARRFEPWQALRYRPGGKFDPHLDTGLYTADGNERLYTIIVGLKAPAKGGETKMVALNREYKTEPGKAIIWRNLDTNNQPRQDRMHAGLPVEEGEKFVLVTWVRLRVP